jgi:peptidoglycan-N-acetylglucosamine deacetylase
VLRPILFATGSVTAAQWAPAAAAVLPAAARALGIPTRLASDDAVLLTFDDGPHPEGTPAVLAALDQAGLPAVFFLSGEQAARYPGLVREIAAAGHELALHGYRHQTRRQWSPGLLADDTRRALDALGTAAGTGPRLYRPPHGVFTLTGLRLIHTLGLVPLLWSKWGRDWEHRASAATIARNVTRTLQAGDVLLLHDADHYGAPESWRKTVAALPAISERITAVGLRAGTIRAGPQPAVLLVRPAAPSSDSDP